jgi:hypothetical protein
VLLPPIRRQKKRKTPVRIEGDAPYVTEGMWACRG